MQGTIQYTDMFLSIKTLAAAPNGVITQFTAIPFDIATGFYLGMETETDEPLDAYTKYPDIQAQLNSGRVVDAYCLSNLINGAAAGADLPIWLDDETGDLRETLADFGIFTARVCDPDKVRVWLNRFDEMCTLRDAVYQMLREDSLNIPEKAQDERIYTTTGYGELYGLFNSERAAEFETIHHEQTDNSVVDALAGVKEASALWRLMDDMDSK